MLSYVAAVLGLAVAAHGAVIDQENLPNTGLDTTSWTTGSLPPIAGIVCANDFQIAAKNTMSAQNYAYFRTAALDEIAYNRNILDWQKIQLYGYTLADVSNINLKTSILGYQFNAPFFIAPAAQAGLASSGAESNLAKAAGAAGILYAPSISATQTLETIASAAAPGQVMFHQEYIWSDSSRLQSELTRMEQNGYKAIFLTVDNTGTSGIRNRYQRFVAGGDSGHSATFTVAALQKLQTMTKLPIVPKGVKTAHDVKAFADLGFPAVYISNHGGRQVDLVPTAVEIMLDVHRLYPEILGKIEIYADGGVRRASHILTLLSLGVTAVGMGRPFIFANVYGQSGVTQLINVLIQELKTEMQNMGQADVTQFRGNSSFINTKKVELDYFGAPLGIDLGSSPTTIAKPLYTQTATVAASSSTASSSAGTVSSSSSDSSATSLTSSSSSAISSSSASAPGGSSTSTTLVTSASSTTSSSGAGSTAAPSCPASNGSIYTAASGRSFQIECGIDHSGGDLKSQNVSSFKACIDLCDSTTNCVDVSLSGVACYLKSSLGAVKTATNILGAKLLS